MNKSSTQRTQNKIGRRGNKNYKSSRTNRHNDCVIDEITLKKNLLYDLEECSVKLGEYLVAVFKLETNIVGLHPGYVLDKDKERQGVSGKAVHRVINEGGENKGRREKSNVKKKFYV